MSHGACQTVAIATEPTPQNPTGIIVINESDFDASTMTLATVEEPVVLTEVKPPVEPPVDTGGKVVAPWAAK